MAFERLLVDLDFVCFIKCIYIVRTQTLDPIMYVEMVYTHNVFVNNVCCFDSNIAVIVQ